MIYCKKKYLLNDLIKDRCSAAEETTDRTPACLEGVRKLRQLIIVGKSNEEITFLKKIFEPSYLISVSEHMSSASIQNDDYSALILLLDDQPEQYLSELEQFTANSVSPELPVLVATRQPESLQVRQAIRRGAIDYVDLNRHSFLIQNRMRNLMKFKEEHSIQSDSINRLLFYRCIGPAMMLEVSDDEAMLHIVMVNKEYYELAGIPSDFYDDNSNLLDTVLPSEAETTRKAIHEAVTGGNAYCLFTNPEINKTFKATYHLALRTEYSTILLMTLQDVTETEKQKVTDSNFLRLPGMTIFTYDPETDTASFLITSRKDKRTTKEHKNLMNASKQTLVAPESYLTFRRAIENAKNKKTPAAWMCACSLMDS